MSKQDAYEQVISKAVRLWGLKEDASGIYLEALERFSETDLKAAWARVVETWNRPTTPPPGAFVKAAIQSRKGLEVADFTEGKHNWGGECACEWCRGDKVARGKRRNGFFQASREQQREGNQITRELNAWIESQARAKPTRPRPAKPGPI